MATTRTRRAALAVGAALALSPTAASAAPPIWELNQGATIAGLTDTDDSDAPSPALGTFAFPFYGTTYTGTDVLTVSSNGFIKPGAHPGLANDNSPTGLELTTSAQGIIAPYWTDLITANIPPDQGDVLFNTFNDDGDPAIDRVVITWKANSFGCANPAPAYPGCKNDAQVQLLESGRIIFGYDGVHALKGSTVGALAGAAKGGLTAAEDPGSRDLSAAGLPFAFGSIGYELFVGDPLKVDVDQRNLVLDPVGTTGFSLDQLGEDIAVTTTATPTVVAGGTITYGATVVNNGEATATDVRLTDVLPPGTEFVSSSAGCTGTSVASCALGDLNPGQSASATITVRALSVGTITNNVSARPSQAGDPATDNSASASTVVTAPPAGADTVPGPLPAAPAVTARVASQKLRAAAGGIKVTVTCAAACGVVATASVDAATARRLRSARTLGSASNGRKTAGTVSFKVPVGKAVGRRIRSQRSLKVKLTFEISTEAGERTTSRTTTIRK